MAYGKIYEVKFTNRIQNDTYRLDIYQRDYADDSTSLIGAETPVTVNYQDGELLDPIKASELTFTIVVNFSALDIFYSDDDEKFRAELYYEGDSDVLLWCGYLIQDGVSEPVTDQKHTVTLKATDNLALLKNVKLNEADPNYYGKHALGYYLRVCLEETGLYSSTSTIDKSLPLRIYANVFENTTNDRSDDTTSDPFAEVILDSNVFLNTDNTWDDCYTVLEKILRDYNATLLQANGCWNVIRTPEYKFFAGSIHGTEYIYNGSGTDITAITLDATVTVDRTDADCYPVLEDQTKTLERPVKKVLNTFNYNQPASFIKNSDLQLPSGATPYDTDTVGDFRYDRYDLATYFPFWVQRDGDTSYLEIVTDTVSDTETDRYIVTPSPNDTTRGVQFNPIPVSKGDVLDFSCQYRTFGDTDNMLNFGVRFVIIGTGPTSYQLIDFPPIISSASPGLIWQEIDSTDWDIGNGVHAYISDSEADDIDTTQYANYSLSGFLGLNKQLPLIPADGMLLVQVVGTNTYAASENTTTLWKDVTLDIKQYVNSSTQVIGQTHLVTGSETNKAVNESELNIDDAPRRTIGGALYTDALTIFSYTDSTTGEDTNINNDFFTLTSKWHRGTISESLRLGNIIAEERLELKHVSRLIIEGTFRNLRYNEDQFVSMLSYFSFIPFNRLFLPAGMEIDYMNCSFKTKMIEVVNEDAEDAEYPYEFKYIYKTD